MPEITFYCNLFRFLKASSFLCDSNVIVLFIVHCIVHIVQYVCVYIYIYIYIYIPLSMRKRTSQETCDLSEGQLNLHNLYYLVSLFQWLKIYIKVRYIKS